MRECWTKTDLPAARSTGPRLTSFPSQQMPTTHEDKPQASRYEVCHGGATEDKKPTSGSNSREYGSHGVALTLCGVLFLAVTPAS